MRFYVLTGDGREAGKRGLFSGAIWIVLEKLGFSHYAVLPWTRYVWLELFAVLHVALVTAPVSRRQRLSDLELLIARNQPVFLEGPWPEALDECFGTALDRDSPSRTGAQVVVEDAALRRRLEVVQLYEKQAKAR
jgi:hypothetical protein